jgi:hypothetical protein
MSTNSSSGPEGAGGLQRARVQDLAGRERSNVALRERQDGDRVAAAGNELNLETGRAITMHHGPDVSRAEAHIWEVAPQDDSIELFQGAAHGSPLAGRRGNAVTNRGSVRPVSTIHTVRSAAVVPFGAVNSPSTIYRMPNGVAVS